MDRILIRELVVLGILGAYESEREQPREIVIDLDLFMDLRPAGQSDDLADCLNYDEVITLISEHVATLNRFTVEALATASSGEWLGQIRDWYRACVIVW